MDAAAVGGAFLSAFLQVLLDRLASPQLVNFIYGNKVDANLIQRLKNTLYAVEAVLNDAELKQIKDSAVNNWLDDLKDALYIADDILDHISTKAATTHKNKEVSTTASSYLSRFFNFEERDMVRKLEDIVARLESILKHKDIIGLQHIATHHHSSWRTPSTSLDHGSNIFGRNQDIEDILNLLLHDGDDVDSDKISVIPIVGMGGVGKTTLAQSVYNHQSIKQKFDVQAWVCVSDAFDVLKVTKATAEEVKSASNTNNLNILQQDLKDKLTGKKFLIVLDDVWTEDYDNWNSLIKPLRCGAKGSKILVTTRNEKVVSMVQTFQGHYSLKQLSDEDCWYVFAKHACLSQEKSTENMDLEKIGKEIVRKCKGLPIAAQSLGGLLRRKRDIRDWNNILNSNIWEIDENASKIISALRISYHYLPSYLKRCFVYCSLYPKDYKFDKDDLILLWMAEDLLQPPENGKTLEEVGYEYFNDLASRSFFQRFGSGNRSQHFVMHDLVHDLATLIGAKFYLRTEELGKETKIDNKTRHLSFNNLSEPVADNFEIFDRAKHLRTVLTISFRGELINLRYVDLSFKAMKTLPESLCNLYNLQTLKLYNCYQLIKLPNGMQKLVNLRYLDIRYTPMLEDMPSEMGKLNHLQHLSCFVVGKHKENGIKELGPLSNLHGSLSISKLENVSNNIEASQANIMDKKYLEELSFEWSDNAKDQFTNSQSEMDILDKLHPAKNLKKVSIWGYRGTRFPEWIGDPSYQNLTKLSLSDCHNCCILPPLGQLRSLKDLSIKIMSMLQTIGSEYGDSFSGILFPTLERLEFDDMPCWEVWHHPHDSNAYFPVLKSLVIRGCPLLRGDLPSHLPALETIQIEQCDKFAFSLPRALAIRKLVIRENNKVVLRELPLSLEEIEIHGREATESFFEVIAITLPISLKIVSIENCSSAISFPGDWLPASLKSLSITDCRNLDFPKQKQQHESLQWLDIDSSCGSLTTLPLETFPNLSGLHICQCENLECVSAPKTLQNLNEFAISNCPKFASFPREGLSPPKLTSLLVEKCVNLKSLPCHANTLLPNLESVSIRDCPEMETFCEGGMPPSLRRLEIYKCEKLVRCPSLSLMDMLTDLTIDNVCDGVESFPNKDCALLPPSLTSLSLSNMPSLHTLDCTELLHLTSLQELTIEDCYMLENMAGERLPATLTILQIFKCPLLEERCRMKHPQIWPKISHIQGILVDHKWI
ncbi:putative disease resistance RPP13-like protein 1 isoform X2 [Cicer arietinum]|uniref:Disease resistance protein At3g14460 isoform X2 n=1 Tax=Cicer arietinum TaxID=3827 RepID=A0A1S2X9M9_CICAR|nr:putative disease resistance protein At3g14460 isoform X2 [Cicer arietinum]